MWHRMKFWAGRDELSWADQGKLQVFRRFGKLEFAKERTGQALALWGQGVGDPTYCPQKRA